MDSGLKIITREELSAFIKGADLIKISTVRHSRDPWEDLCEDIENRLRLRQEQEESMRESKSAFMKKRKEKKKLKIFEKVWRIVQTILFDDGARIGKPDPVRTWIKRELDNDERVIASYYRAKMMRAEEAEQWLFLMGQKNEGKGLCSIVSPSNLAEQVGDLVKIGFNPAAVFQGGFLKIDNLEDLIEAGEGAAEEINKLSDLVDLDDLKEDLKEDEPPEEMEEPDSDEYGPPVHDWTDELVDEVLDLMDWVDEGKVSTNNIKAMRTLTKIQELINENVRLNGPEEPDEDED